MHINEIFKNMKLDANCIKQYSHENSTFYDIKLGNNITLSKFKKNIDEIIFRLGIDFDPYIEVCPQEGIICLQVVNNLPDDIDFLDHYSTPPNEYDFFLGKDYFGKNIYLDLEHNSNILLAGTTGSGKSVALHSFIANAFLCKHKIELFLGDPKLVEFSSYKNLSIVNDVAHSYEDHLSMLNYVFSIMEQRFEILKDLNASNINDIPELSRVVVIVDEISDLMIQDSQHKNYFQTKLISVAQKCRAAGINLIMATQRPSVDVLPGIIKANFPTRIACKVSSKIDSNVILDDFGAENLLGRGDAVVKSFEHKMTRFKFPSIKPGDFV